MTQTDRRKGFDLTPDATPAPRPKIWVEGHQRPRFSPGAFARVSLAMAKRDLAPEITDAADRLSHWGDRLQRGEGRVNVAWAGRAGRALPSAARVGAWVLGLSTLFRTAHSLLVPSEPADEPVAYPNLLHRSAAPPPKAVLRVVEPKAVEPTLHAIRSAIQSSPHDHAHERAPTRPVPDPAPTKPRTNRLASALHTGAGWVLLAVLLAFALPAGALRALMFHLEGGDLAEWS